MKAGTKTLRHKNANRESYMSKSVMATKQYYLQGNTYLVSCVAPWSSLLLHIAWRYYELHGSRIFIDIHANISLGIGV